MQTLPHCLAAVQELSPSVSQPVQEFKSRHFRKLNIGIQIRRKKCALACAQTPCNPSGTGQDDCKYLPEIANFAMVAKALQIARRVDDKDTAFFVATDKIEVYEQVRLDFPTIFHNFHCLSTSGMPDMKDIIVPSLQRKLTEDFERRWSNS